MKIYYFIPFILLIVSLHSNGNQISKFSSQPLTSRQVTSLATLGKVWGFLKYYHPNVAKGQYNWDSMLLEKIPIFLAATKSPEVNIILSAWLRELGPVNSCQECDNQISDKVTYNLDTMWIANSGFNQSLIADLKYIQNNRSQGEKFYITYGPSKQIKIINEKAYNTADYTYPSPSYRLLTLFRYWNIVNYFFPYKYLTSKKWESVLAEFIPIFYHAKNPLEYHLSISKLIATIKDGHAYLDWSSELKNFLGDYGNIPFRCTIIDGKAVVVELFNEPLCKSQGLGINDIIISVDGETIENRIKKYSPYVYNASNDASKNEILCGMYLFRGTDSICSIVKWTQSGNKKSFIKRYAGIPPIETSPEKSWKILSNNIGYINMGLLLPQEVDNVMDSLNDTKGIVIDVRNYPENTWHLIAARLSSKNFIMSRMSYPDLDYPGVFRFHRDQLFGNANKSVYKGSVVLLVNAISKSHAEFSVMGIQAAKKTITIGSQTAGADGDVTDLIVLPGGFRTRFSGLGIYYPDGTVVQRRGVKIDVICKPSLKGIRLGKDELIEAAIQVITLESRAKAD